MSKLFSSLANGSSSASSCLYVLIISWSFSSTSFSPISSTGSFSYLLRMKSSIFFVLVLQKQSFPMLQPEPKLKQLLMFLTWLDLLPQMQAFEHRLPRGYEKVV
ncbi:hypothetical protein NBT10_07685 [Enterococcus faecium]|nr:hypothetical protein [Enterococcus faecium]MCL9978851.1 hypothetical protein [Enterococcus faecium]